MNSKLKIKNLRFKIALFTCVFIFSSLPLFAQMPEPSAPRNFSIQQPVEKTLPNGLRVIIIQTKNVPLVNVSFLVKSGAETDPKNLAGLANFSMSLLTKGTKTRSATQIAEETEFLGGMVWGGSNWDSSNAGASVTSDKVDNIMEILADVIFNPTFSQEEIDRQREQLLDSLSLQMKQAGSIANLVSTKLVYGANSKYAHSLTGTPESVQRIKQSDLVEFHKNNLLTSDAVLTFAGDITTEKALALATKYFSKIPKGKIGKGKYDNLKVSNKVNLGGKEKSKLSNIVVVDLPNSGQAAVQYVQPGFQRESNDYYKANVFNSILGGGYSSRLNQEVRIKRGLSYGANSSFQTRRESGLFRMSTQTKNESAAEVVELFVEELNKIGTVVISESELTPRKSVLTGDYGRGLATSSGLAVTVGNLIVYGLPLSDINTYIQHINAVSSQDVKNFASNNLTADKGLVVIVGDYKIFSEDLKKRFPSTNIRVIPADKLDLESDGLEKK